MCLLFSVLMTGQAEPVLQTEPTISNAWAIQPMILPDLQGQTHQLYEWRGKIILLNFWATWCRPCQIEIPYLMGFYRQYADRGLTVIGVGLDDQRKLKNYVRTVGISYPVLHADPQRHAALLQQWGNAPGVLPYTVVIARDGHLLHFHTGLFDSETFERIVKPLLETENES